MKNVWKIQLKFPQTLSLLLVALVMVFIHHTRETRNRVHQDPQVLVQEGLGKIRAEKDDLGTTCNVFSGRWVYDNSSHPLYEEGKCPFMADDFACEKFGRKDLRYQNWRWQPHGCELPRFNGTAMVEKIRGKRVVYVGDSLNRNLWRSMLCLTHSFLPPTTKRSMKATNSSYYFHLTEHNASIEFYWAPMLAESNCDNIEDHREWPRVVRIKSIENHARNWNNADILVFDSFAWWMGRDQIIILWGSFGSPDAVEKRVDKKLLPYEIALRTWSNWIEMHINRTKTKLFFVGPTAYREGTTMWGSDHQCLDHKEPVFDETYWRSYMSLEMMGIIESTIKDLDQRGVKVEYLNITQLSAYRGDAHPATHRMFWGVPTARLLKDPTHFADCLHWCLPGVPDVWNQILYYYIMKS